MSDVFASIDRATLVDTPFPHLVVEDALPKPIADTLLSEMPSLEVFTRGRPAGSNARHPLPSPLALADERPSQTWKDALRACLDASQSLLDRTVARLGDHIRRAYPGFEDRFAPLDELRIVPRGAAGQRANEIGMDAQIVINSPALTGGTRVRGPHVDAPNKLVSGLLYLRAPDDDSTGGELELYAPSVNRLTFGDDGSASVNSVRLVRRYPYRHNLLILPINTAQTLHAVSPRSQTPRPRYHLHLVGEMNATLFDIPLAPLLRVKSKLSAVKARLKQMSR